jgi:hypothetical protein
LSEGGITREIIRIENETPNCHILKVQDPTTNPPKKLSGATKRSGLDVSGFPSGQEIEVITMNYSGDTEKTTKIRLDK